MPSVNIRNDTGSVQNDVFPAPQLCVLHCNLHAVFPEPHINVNPSWCVLNGLILSGSCTSLNCYAVVSILNVKWVS